MRAGSLADLCRPESNGRMTTHPLGHADLRGRGFQGFHTIESLRASLPALAIIPSQPGVYAVLKSEDAASPTRATAPTFLKVNPGGHFKGSDPTVPVAQLRDGWCADASVLYFGQSGAGTSSQTLRTRLRLLLQFGIGKPIGHMGGRLLWQVPSIEQALIAWLPSGTQDPAERKRRLIAEFAGLHGKRPIANLVN